MTARLLLDEMYPPNLANLLREKGHDVASVADSLDLIGVPDSVVLEAAREVGRCVVTENVRDFVVLTQETSHSGVVLVNARRWPRTPSGLNVMAQALHELLESGRVPGNGEVHWLHR